MGQAPLNWEARTPEHHDLMQDNVVVGRVRADAAHAARWVADIADQGVFRGIGQGTRHEAQHIVAQEASRRLRAHLPQDSAARFGLDSHQPARDGIAPGTGTGLRLIRGGAADRHPECPRTVRTQGRLRAARPPARQKIKLLPESLLT